MGKQKAVGIRVEEVPFNPVRVDAEAATALAELATAKPPTEVASDFQGPHASRTQLSQDYAEAERTRALADVVTCEQEIQSYEGHGAMHYAAMVRAVGRCLALGLTRKDIANALIPVIPPAEAPVNQTEMSDGDIVTVTRNPGRIARYVKIAQWQGGEYTESEVRPAAVVIMGERYTDPLSALDSGKHTYSAVYQAWRNASKKPLQLSAFYVRVSEAATAASKNWRVKVRVVKDGAESLRPESVLVTEDARALFGALKGLVTYGKASERLSPDQKQAIRDLIGGSEDDVEA